MKNRGIVVTRPALCNPRLSLLESKIAFNYCDKVDPLDFGEEAVKQVSFLAKWCQFQTSLSGARLHPQPLDL